MVVPKGLSIIDNFKILKSEYISISIIDNYAVDNYVVLLRFRGFESLFTQIKILKIAFK